MARFFEGSLQELKTRNPGTNTNFQKVDLEACLPLMYIIDSNERESTF
jgi:hypothetical protein